MYDTPCACIDNLTIVIMFIIVPVNQIFKCHTFFYRATDVIVPQNKS